MPKTPIVVRRGPFIFLFFIAVGGLFSASPWLADLQAPICFRLLSTALGLLSLIAGLVGLNYMRIGFAVDQHGVWLQGWSMPPRLVLVRWEHLEGAQLVQWTDPDGDDEGIALGLSPQAFADITRGNLSASHHRKEMERVLGPIPWENPFFLKHFECEWTPTEIAAAIDRGVRDPQSRASLGAFERERGRRRWSAADV